MRFLEIYLIVDRGFLTVCVIVGMAESIAGTFFLHRGEKPELV